MLRVPRAEAAFSLAAAIPGIGELATAGKYATKTLRAVDRGVNLTQAAYYGYQGYQESNYVGLGLSVLGGGVNVYGAGRVMTDRVHPEKWIVSLQLEMHSPGSDTTRVTLRLGVPQPALDGESYGCLVSTEGLDGYSIIPILIGIDSWQSLWLALVLVRSALGYAIERGATFCRFGEVVEISDLFETRLLD